ncbi:MAG: hypothetical protein BGO55_05255 [Sphingobacteriales bacterium 50-39]|nr:hypothetical protein [Sphingobacteriales bacterium]OJW56014.1 MAG: hypothetical protein BGO55_05255 [Sphingobacteriales bacterium 50-39]
MRQITNLRRTAITMALFLTLGISYSFARPSLPSFKPFGSNDEISVAFSKSFRHAQIISKESHKTYTKLTFRMNDMIMFAYYSENGELLAVTRNILSTQLPMNLLVDLRTDYNNYWISDLFELSGEGQDCYYVTIENADVKVTLHSVGDKWEEFSKTQKQ